MKIQKCALFACSMLASISVYAKLTQVDVCVDVKNNQSPYAFYAGYETSDALDSARYTASKENGRACKMHLYKFGPKNVTYFLRYDPFFCL